MLGGSRGALSIALAATITTSALISVSDLHTINTMVFGVAFISIILQVPLLLRYVRRNVPESEIPKEIEVDAQFAKISSAIQEAQRLKAENKISEKEFTERMDENRMELERIIAKSRLTLETREIIRKRVSILFPSLPKKPKQKQENEEASDLPKDQQKNSR